MPYFYSLNKSSNKFVSKFESVYVQLFKVETSLSLEKLVQILEKIAQDEKIDPKRTQLLIRNIFDVIESDFLNEFINLKSQIKLPVIDLKTQDRIVFELSEKCVYLNEDESKDDEIGFLHTKIESCDEKGLKICDQRLNVKLLNKLGVKSFAEKETET